MRKRILLIISLLFLSLTGCSLGSTESSSSEKTTDSEKVQASIGAVNTEESEKDKDSYLDKDNFKKDYKEVSVGENPIYPSIFLDNGTSTVFPNFDDNNKISILNEPYDEGTVNTSYIADFFDYSTYSLTVLDDEVYFSQADKNGILACVNIKDKSYSVISTQYKVSSLASSEGYIYFINNTNNNNLTSYDTTKKTFNLISADNVGKYLIDGENIFYENKSDKSTLYSVSIDGKNRQKLTDFPVESFAPYDGSIIAINSSDDNNLYSINLEDLSTKRLAIMYGENLKNVNGYLYFINVKNNKHLENMYIDYNGDDTASVGFEDISYESINDYYITDKCIFIQRSSDVNQAYSILNE